MYFAAVRVARCEELLSDDLFQRRVEHVPTRAAVIAAATDVDGRFWPRKAAEFVDALDAREARARAFAEIPPEFAVMVARMIHRSVYARSIREA